MTAPLIVVPDPNEGEEPVNDPDTQEHEETPEIVEMRDAAYTLMYPAPLIRDGGREYMEWRTNTKAISRAEWLARIGARK